MKKQLLTGALALSVLMGSTGMAFAASIPATDLIKSDATSAKVDAADAEHFKMSDKKAYTADSYATEIEETKTGLDAMVKSNDMSREDADKILDRMEQELQQIKDGTLTLYYYDMLDKDGEVVGKISMATDPVNKADFKEDTMQENSMQTDTFNIKLNSTADITDMIDVIFTTEVAK